MDEKKIRTLLSFLRDLRAPLKLLPLLLSVVLTLIRRIVEQDRTPGVTVLNQSFLCRKNAALPAGCTSPCVTVCNGGGFAAAYACAQLQQNQLQNHLCMVRSKDCDSLDRAPRRTVYTTPLSPENLTLTDTAFGLFLCWENCGGRSFAAPKAFGKAAADSLKQSTLQAREDAVKDLGWHCALIPNDGSEPLKPVKLSVQATQPPVKISEQEMLFVTAENGKAVVSICTLPKIEIKTVTTLKLPPEENLVCLEATVAKLKNGRLAAVVNLSGELYYAFSDDLGQRWSRLRPMKIKASAPNLCVREDGATALSYLVPNRTLSVCVRISPDGQYVWGRERTVVSTPSADFHRPVTVPCADGFLTVSRQRYCADRLPSALLTRWKENSLGGVET